MVDAHPFSGDANMGRSDLRLTHLIKTISSPFEDLHLTTSSSDGRFSAVSFSHSIFCRYISLLAQTIIPHLVTMKSQILRSVFLFLDIPYFNFVCSVSFRLQVAPQFSYPAHPHPPDLPPCPTKVFQKAHLPLFNRRSFRASAPRTPSVRIHSRILHLLSPCEPAIFFVT